MRAPVDMGQVYTDFAGLTALKGQAREDRDAALDQVTRQFESLFMQMMLKSMRDASLGDGLLDSEQSEFYRDMYDQQLSLHLSESGGMGLAEVLKRQLGGVTPATADTGLTLDDYRAARVRAGALPEAAAGQAAATDATGDVPAAPDVEPVAQLATAPDIAASPDAFVRSLWPAAEQAAARLDVPPEALLAQAALETGWGRHVMRGPDGSSAHNLFGIKADGRWNGEQVSRQTLEYVDGVAVRTRANFRAYASFTDSFADYADFVRSSPRYRDALAAGGPGGYFRALQDAGYATDPEYAAKISRIIDSPEMQTALAELRGPNPGGGGAG